MTKFEKPGSKEWDYPDMARESGTKALEDAGIGYEEIEAAAVGYVYGESCSGERAAYELGITGIPIYNVNNNCSTGSTALCLAANLVRGGLNDCVLALGFEKMNPGSLGATFMDREQPTGRHFATLFSLYPAEASPPAAQMFGMAGREHMEKYGSKPEHFAWIGYKNHKHSVNNPYSQFQDEYTLAQVEEARVIYAPVPLTLLQCSPTSDGSGAAILASERFVEDNDLWATAIEIVGQSMVTDMTSSFEDQSAISAVGAKMTSRAASEVYEQAQTGPDEVDVCELHDCFSANELITYEGLGFAAEGEGQRLIETEATTYGGSGPVVNPSGGLISKGHPLGATGLAQCAELNWQLRGRAERRQVDGAKVALQHNIGIGGAAVVTMYKPPS
jgi:acetyl-CoA acetyltransferase